MDMKTLIKNNKKQAKWNEDIRRRESAQIEIDFYNNNQAEYMNDYYNALFQNQNKRSLVKAHSQYLNLTEQIIDQLAVAFKSGVDVELFKSSETEKSETTKAKEEELRDILDSCMFDANLKTADKLALLNHYCAISAVWDSEKKAIRLDIIPASICFVEQNERSPREIKAFYYQINITENSPTLADNITLYQRWTAETSDIVSVDGYGNSKVIESYPNPYKQIPIVAFMPELPLFGYFPDKRNLLVEWNTTTNKELTDYEITHTIQNHAILAIINADIGTELTAGQNSFLNLYTRSGAGTGNADAKYLNPGIDLEKLLNTIKTKAGFYANSMGISATLYNNNQSDFSSGYQLKLSMSGVIDKVNERLPYYQKSVQDLVRLITDIYNYNNQKTFNNYEIFTKIRPLKVEMSEGEKVDTNLKKVTLGTTSQVEIIMEDEGISRAEAEERIAQIKADNNIGTGTIPPTDILGN